MYMCVLPDFCNMYAKIIIYQCMCMKTKRHVDV